MRKDVIAVADGNAAVREFLRMWQEEVDKGEVMACVAAFSRGEVDVRTGHAGIIGAEFPLFFGLSDAMELIRERIREIRDPPMADNVAANRVMYNLMALSCSFDFVPWYVQAEMTRIREGAPPPLRVGFYPGASGSMDMALNNDVRRQHFNNVMLPFIEMMGGVVDPTAVDGRQKRHLSFDAVFAAWRNGEQVPKLAAKPEAEVEIRKALTELYGRMPVTITLREAESFPHRNSNVPEWIRFGEWLKSRGETVLYVRDTAKVEESLGEGLECCPPASVNLFSRVALYQCAKCNLFVSNGPAVLALLMDRPYLMFQQIVPNSNYCRNRLRAGTTSPAASRAGSGRLRRRASASYGRRTPSRTSGMRGSSISSR